MNIVTLTILIAVFAAVTLYFVYNKPNNTPKDSASSDAKVIDQLRKAGSDLGKIHEIEFFFYFPTEASASKISDQLNTDGFKTNFRKAADNNNWVVFATKEMVPELSAIENLSIKFNSIAAAEHGKYDGWETQVRD